MSEEEYKAKSGYYEKLSQLQKDIIARYHEYIHHQMGQSGLNGAGPHEWDLSTTAYYLRKDNDALRELCEEYKQALHRAEGFY